MDVAGLAEVADTLSESLAIGRLRQVCEGWIYSSCLCFGLEMEEQGEQERSRFQYQYSIDQPGLFVAFRSASINCSSEKR